MGQGAGRALNSGFIPVDDDFKFRRRALLGAVREGVIDHHDFGALPQRMLPHDVILGWNTSAGAQGIRIMFDA